ncbi:MAG: ABC transporter substrate-binding protein [Bacillota bacterium]
MKYRSMLCALLTILLLSLACAGCGQETAEPPGEEDPVAEPESEPDDGIDLTTMMVGRDMPTTLDPGKANDVCSATPVRAMYETLVGYKGSGTEKLEPVLAERWDISSDGLTYTFHLREGVKFHDGTDLDAEAVRFSFARAIELGHAPADIFKPVGDITVLDAHTLQITLQYPYAPFLYTLASQVGPLVVSPTAVREHEEDGDLAEEWLHDHAVGTGPFQFEEWIPGQQVSLIRFDDYWKGWEEHQKVEMIIIKNVVEPATVRMLLEKGDLDTSVFSSQDDWPAFEANPDIDLNRNATLNTLYHMINVISDPLDDVRVREAVSLAYNAQQALEQVFRGYAYELRGVLPSNQWGYAGDLAPHEYDLDRAAELLAEAGHPGGGFKMQYGYVEGSEPARQAAEVWQAGLSNIGVELEIIPMTWPTLWSAISDPDTAPESYAFYWYPRVADPNDWLYVMFHSEMQGSAGYNCIYYENPRVDELLDAARRTPDRDARVDMYEEVQHLIADNYAIIPVAQLDAAYPMRTWVKGYVFNPMYIGTYNFYDMYKSR